MKPKIGASVRGRGICLGGSLNEAAKCLKSTRVKEAIRILDVNELRSTVSIRDRRLNTYEVRDKFIYEITTTPSSISLIETFGKCYDVLHY